MAQLRQDYEKFKALNTEVVVIVPNGPRMIERHVTENRTPYLILSDKGSRVAESYQIEMKKVLMLKAFTASAFMVDKTGRIFYTSYSPSFLKEPDNNELLAELSKLMD